MDPILQIYILNLLVTGAMFCVLIFRAWVEMKNYRIVWKEQEWLKTREVAGKILKAEKDLFKEVEGGQELYKLLCEMFQTSE